MTKKGPEDFARKVRGKTTPNSGTSKVLVFVRVYLLTCMLPTFCLPMMWAILWSFIENPTFWRLTISSEHAVEKLWPPHKLWT